MRGKPKPKKWERRKKTPDNPFDAGWDASGRMFSADDELSRPGIGDGHRRAQELKREEAERDMFRAEDFRERKAAKLKAAREAASIGAAKRNEPVIAAMRKAVESGGAENMADTIRKLKKADHLTPVGRAKPLSDATARKKLKKKFGIQGKPGRRKSQ